MKTKILHVSKLLSSLHRSFHSGAWLFSVLVLLPCPLGWSSDISSRSTSAIGDSGSVLIDPNLLSKLETSILQEHGFEDEFEAEVWFTSMLPRLARFSLDKEEKIQILQWVHRESHRNSLSPSLVLAVIQVESSFDRYAVSRSGAQGLMQVMSFWKAELGRNDDNLIDTKTNLRYGTTILSYYLERANGNTTEALARYNGSYPNTWYAERVYRALERWH